MNTLNPDVFPSLEKRDAETPSSYEAFMDYVYMGADRSLRQLAERYKKAAKAPTRSFDVLKGWSVKYDWQKRVGEYLNELQRLNSTKQAERLEAFSERVWGMYGRLADKVEEMLDEFQTNKITRRKRIPHPEKADMQLEIVNMKVNVSDLRQLISAFGRLGKDLRLQLGMPERLDVTSGGETLKGYVNVSPDDFDVPDDD